VVEYKAIDIWLGTSLLLWEKERRKR